MAATAVKSGPAASPGASIVGSAQASSMPSGLTPANLRSAYNLTTAAASGGKGATVAIIGVYDDPNAASDLAAYRSQYGLPACTTASDCLTKVNEDGQASPLPPTAPSQGASASWAQAESMDMDMVSAVCPNCRILLVEGSAPGVSDMGTAVNSAVRLGARFVIVGWSLPGMYNVTIARDLDQPGVAITAPAGDSGYPYDAAMAYSFPVELPYVTAVGGTVLRHASNSRGWSETVWGPPTAVNNGIATSSGCAADIGKPSWQHDTGCTGRTFNDVAAVATGVSFYDTTGGGTGWYIGSGTTISASIIGAVYALAGTPAADTFPVTYPYLHTTDLYQVTSGSDAYDNSCSPQPAYLCTAGPGYNGPAGWGTPDGTTAFSPSSPDAVSMLSPGEQRTDVLPEAVNLQIQALDSGGETLTYTATGLPPGTSIDSSSGLISGTVTKDYNEMVSVTAKDPSGASATVSFRWYAENRFVIGNPGTQQTEPGAQINLKLGYYEGDKSATVAFTASGLPPGLTIDSSTGVISGTASSTIARYDVTVSATDSAETTSTASFTWKIWNKITVNVPDFEQSYVGVPISPVALIATDSAPGKTLTFSAVGLPPGLSINGETGVISGTPAAMGYPSVMVTVTDGTGSAGTVPIYWMVGGKITFTNPGAETTGAGQAVYLPLAVKDTAADDTLAYTIASTLPGLSISPSRPVITGWPNTPGEYRVSVFATGDYGGAASVSFTWTVRAASESGPTGPVRLNFDGKCLDDTNNSTANGNKIQIWTCNGLPNQKWTYAEDGTLRIHGKCLDIVNRSTAAGAKLQLWTCNGGENQRWAVIGNAQLMNPASEYCLSDPADSAKNGTQLRIAGCGSIPSQEWTLPAGPVLSAIPGKCMDDTADSTANGNKIQTWTCNGLPNQKWTIEPNGTIQIAGKCLDDTNNGSDAGNKIQLWTCNGLPNQQWAVQPVWNVRPADTPEVSFVGIQLRHGSLCASPVSMTAANGSQLVLGNCSTDEAAWQAW